jgi:hypothetical protein
MKMMGVFVVPPWGEDDHVAALPRVCKEAGITEVAMMVQCHPQTPPLMQKIDEAMARFRKAAKALRAEGIGAGILLQTLLDHGERFRPLPTVDFQRITDDKGVECPAVFCPSDEGFLAYTSEMTRRLAEAGPDFLLIDDDVRLRSHAPVKNGCFCPLHLVAFGKHFGEDLDRPTLMATFAEDSERGRRAREAWLAVRRETFLTLGRTIREAIDAVDPSIRCGTCRSDHNMDTAEDFTRSVAGETEPFMRLAGARYLEGDLKNFGLTMMRLGSMHRLVSPDMTCMSEADTCPHSRYSLSATSLSAYIACALLMGADHPKLWIADCNQWADEDTGRYRQELGRRKDFFEAIRLISKEADWIGPQSPTPLAHPLHVSWRPDEGLDTWLSRGKNWASQLLGRFGIPWTTEISDEPMLLAGRAAHALTDEEVRYQLQRGLLLDGEAAAILTDRGYAELMGVRAEMPPTPLRITYDQFTDDAELNGAAANTHNRTRTDDAALLTPLHDDVRTFSEFTTEAYYQAPEATVIAPSGTAYENALGGRVVVYANMPASGQYGTPNDRLKAQLISLLGWLRRAPLPLWPVGTADVFVRFGNIRETNDHLLTLMNLSTDVIEPLELNLPTLRPEKLERLTLDGVWEEIDFTMDGTRLRLDVRLYAMEPLFLRIR